VPRMHLAPALVRHTRFAAKGAVAVLGAVLATAWLVTAPAGASAAAAPGSKGGSHHTMAPPRLPHRSVASILRADGTLRTGVRGSFSPKGYRMVLGHHGAPRFVRAGVAAAGDTSWDNRFGLPGVQNGIEISQVNAIAVAAAMSTSAASSRSPVTRRTAMSPNGTARPGRTCPAGSAARRAANPPRWTRSP
jgi:hypothetical protein